MKKTMIIAACALGIIAFGAAESKPELRVVPMSKVQWQSIQDQVNTNGYCHVKEQNVVLVITNGCPNAEHLLPVWNVIPEADLERNKLRIKDKREKKPPYVEPMPYVGQGTLQ